jgi:hypothetical protein
MAYAAYTDVTPRLAGRTFSGSTEPSTTDITAWITYAEAEIDSTLTAIGLDPPITDSDGVEVLKGIACLYAEGQTRLALDTNNAGEGDDGSSMIERFFTRLKEIRDDAAFWYTKLGEGSGSRVHRNEDLDEDGPDFSRDFET